jgi:ribosomal RNA-processing protein 36
MLSIKRKPLAVGLQRRVRARREASKDVESSELPSDNGDNPASDEDNSDPGESEEEVCTIRVSVNAL